MRGLQLVACSALLFGACAPQYRYRPTTHATGEVAGHVAAEYQIPHNAPVGDLRVASFGISKVSSRRNPDVSFPAVHLRMVVANNGTQPMTLDTRQQVLAFFDGTKARPAFARTNQGIAGLPEVTIPPGDKRIVDMFYRVPANLQSAKNIPEFDAISRVDVGQQVVSERTPFDRLRVEPAYAYGYGPDAYYVGPWAPGPFWYDNMAFPAGYFGPDVIIASPTWVYPYGY